MCLPVQGLVPSQGVVCKAFLFLALSLFFVSKHFLSFILFYVSFSLSYYSFILFFLLFLFHSFFHLRAAAVQLVILCRRCLVTEGICSEDAAAPALRQCLRPSNCRFSSKVYSAHMRGPSKGRLKRITDVKIKKS